MITKCDWRILGGGVGLYLLGLAVLGGLGTVLSRYDQAVRQSHAGPRDLEQNAPAGPEASDAPWSAPLRKVDEALAQKNVSAADLAWHEAFIAALRSRRWEGMVETGNAALRIGEAAGGRRASAAKARQIYSAALFRARQQGSLDGVLRTAEAFAALGDREVAAQGLQIAERLAAYAREAQARDRVRAFKDRLAPPAVVAGSRDFDPF